MTGQRLTLAKILSWARDHHRRTGEWPTQNAGPVAAAPGEKWGNINMALRLGLRGLCGGDTLSRLLERKLHCKATGAPPLTVRQILAWADAHHRRTGRWPTSHSGVIEEAPGYRWNAVATALREGYRGLPGGSSLAQLLAEKRGVRNPRARPPLSVEKVLAWADTHKARTGSWPKILSGPVPEAEGENWQRIDCALRFGFRGLPRRGGLPRLLAEERGVGRGSWSEAEDSLVRMLAPSEVARRTGRSPEAIRLRRYHLGLTNGQG